MKRAKRGRREKGIVLILFTIEMLRLQRLHRMIGCLNARPAAIIAI